MLSTKILELMKSRLLKRRPPVRNHDIDPTDEVLLLKTRNDDWQAGNTYEVKRLAHKNANVIQLKNENNETTFVNADHLEIESERYTNRPKDPRYGEYWVSI